MIINELANNIPALSALISALAVVGGGMFSFVRWLDVRRRELDQQRWSDYAKLMALVSGEAKIPVQMAALFQLAEFKEYSDITIKSLEASNDIMAKMCNADWVTYMTPQTQKVILSLREHS